jgi:hypothetical protein
VEMSISIQREGQFAVTWHGENATQCGAAGTQVLQYRVEIVGSDKHLNPQGFIIDNNAIHDYFIKKYRNVIDFLSCENIAMEACRDLKEMFGRGALNKVKISEIDVTISGGPLARLTASWRKPARRPTPKLAPTRNARPLSTPKAKPKANSDWGW